MCDVASVFAAFESQRVLFTFKKYVEKYDLVQIRAFCGFLTNILKTGGVFSGSAMLDNMKRQFIVSGMMEPIITMVNNELNDVSLLISVLLLVEQICITSEAANGA